CCPGWHRKFLRGICELDLRNHQSRIVAIELVYLPTMPLELLAVARFFDQRPLAETVEHGCSVVDGNRIFEFESRHACRGPFNRYIGSLACDPDSNKASYSG